MPRQRSEKTLVTMAFRAGMSKEEYIERRTAAIRASAKAQGWRPSEEAMACADILELADKMYGAVSAINVALEEDKNVRP